MKRYKWVYYDWFGCATCILGTKKEAKSQFKKIKKEQPSMEYHHLQKVRLLSEAENELSC
jgi:hypothetical protein